MIRAGAPDVNRGNGTFAIARFDGEPDPDAVLELVTPALAGQGGSLGRVASYPEGYVPQE